MTYPPEFIARVKAAYPDYPEMIEKAEQGSPWLGRYLCDSVPNGISFITVLTKPQKTLVELAEAGLEKERLWRDWQKTDIAKKNVYGTK